MKYAYTSDQIDVDEL